MGWQLIQEQSLQTSAASVTFSSIPQTFKVLKILISSRTTGTGGQAVLIAPNGSSSNLTYRYLEGSGAAASSNNGAQGSVATTNGTGQTANTFNSVEVTIPNYSGTTNKPMSSDSVTENNATTAYLDLFATLWSNTAAITSLTFTDSGGNSFVFGSTFTLYGLA